MAHRDLAVKQLGDRGKNIVIDAQSIDLLDQALDHRRLGRRHGDDDFLQIQLLDKRGEFACGAEHLLAVERAADFSSVVVHKADDIQPQSLASLNVTQ